MIYYFGLLIISILLTGICHVLLKVGSRQKNRLGNIISPYFNVFTISAYIIFLIVTIVSVVVLQQISLKIFYAITSLNVVVVAALSWVLLKEEMNKKIVIGILFVFLGIMVFNL